MSGSRTALGLVGPPPPPPLPAAADKNAYKEKQKTAIVVRKIRWEEEFPLHFCAMAGDVESLERSIPLSNPPTHLDRTRTNQPDNDTWTPGHYTCFYGNARVLVALLRRGASAHAENLNRCTLLHFAAGRGNTTCVRALLEAGANPNTADDDKMTPFLRCEELKPDGWELISLVIRLCRHLQPCRSASGQVVMVARSAARIPDRIFEPQ